MDQSPKFKLSEDVTTPNHLQVFKRDRSRLNSMCKGNEESTPRKFNQEKIRMPTICKQEAASPKNKNQQFIKSES